MLIRIVLITIVSNIFLWGQGNFRLYLGDNYLNIGYEEKIQKITSLNLFSDIKLIRTKENNKTDNLLSLSLNSYHPNETGLFAIKIGVVANDNDFMAFPITIKYNKFINLIDGYVDSFIGGEISYAPEVLVAQDAKEFSMFKIYFGVPISDAISLDLNYQIINTDYENRDVKFADTASFGFNISF